MNHWLDERKKNEIFAELVARAEERQRLERFVAEMVAEAAAVPEGLVGYLCDDGNGGTYLDRFATFTHQDGDVRFSAPPNAMLLVFLSPTGTYEYRPLEQYISQ